MMTRDEIQRLGLGARLQLLTGDVVDVKSINPRDETITLVYTAPPKAAEPPTVTPLWGAQTASSRLAVQGAVIVSGGIPPAPGGTLLMEEMEAEEKGKTPTTVICGWIELGNATLLE
jgi:hypothetical protein